MEPRMEMLSHLACLAIIVTLAAAASADLQNIDKDCSVYSVCTKRILLETRGACGSDGNFYPSVCDMEVHNCKTNSSTNVFALEFRDSPSECKRRRERRAAAMQSGGKSAMFQNVQVNWQTDAYRRDGLSDIRVTLNLIPDTGTDAIYGNRLWRMGLYASDSPQGLGVKYAYQSNVLDATAMQTPLQPPRVQGPPPPLTLEARTRFDLREICEIRNKHPYFCVEFAKNDASSVQFTVPIRGGVIKVCSRYTCPESAGQGPLARISDFSASIDPYSVESSGNADLRMTLNINPAADTEYISGSGLWRVGVFASNDARGESRYHEDRNILDSRSERAPMYPSRPMALTGSTTFPVAVLGCRYRYLCIEFARGDRPSTEFNMQSTVSCQPKNCEATGGGSSNPSSSASTTAQYSRVSARTQPYQMDSNGDASITMTLIVTPTANTDRIRGTDLWRVGVFASNDARGNSRYLENRNILDSYASRETMYPGRNMELTGTFDFRAGDLGCRYQYLCIEFAKGDRPNPDFNMQSSVSCQAQQCQQPPAPEPEPNPSTSYNRGQSLEARYSSFSARTDPYTMDSNGDANIRMTLTVNPTPDTDSITGYDLWRVGVFASNDDRGRGRYNEVRNILDAREARKAMYASRSMDLTGNFDFRAGDLGCRYQYLCVEFAKGDNPSTEFSMQPSVSCTPQQCRQPPAPEPEPNPSTNQGQGLVARYSSFSAEADPYTMDRYGDANMRMTLSVQTAVDTDTVRGNGLWRVGVFASNDNRGRGTRYNENRNILDAYESRETMYPRRTMELSGNFNFPAGDLGCRYRYLCVELDKGDRPSVDFVMQPSVSCTEQRCQQPTSPDSSSNPNPSTNTNTNSNYQRPDAIYSSVSAVTDEYTVDRNGNANIRMTLSVNPTANTDTIEGSDLWRLGVFASNDPRGTTRYQEIPNILDYSEASRSMYPRRRMDLAGSFDFPAGDLGCRYQYLCVEFAKGIRPSMDFTMESTVSCQPQVCQETTEPQQPTSTGPVARYNQFTAAIEPYEIQTDSSAQMELTATVNPSSSTDYITGNRLWRIGVFASNDNRGRTRYHENRNVIGYADAQQSMRAGRPLELSGSLSFPAAGYLGCQFNFLCIEFDKGENPSVEFEMEPFVSCERQTCGGVTGLNTGGSPSVTSGGGRNPNRGGGGGGSSGSSTPSEPTVDLHSLSWTAESQAIRSDGTTNLIVDASVGMAPSPSPFGGGGASNLWRMGIFTSSSPDGSDRYGESQQILSGMDRYKQVRSDMDNTFSSTTNFNVRNLGCSPTTRYLCLEFGKGPDAVPSYTMTGGNTNDNSILTCRRQECDQDPAIRVIGVRPSVVELREGERNPVTFDVNVRYDPVESTRIQGSNLWKLQAFGSKSPEGTGPQTSFSDQVLGAFQEDTLFDPSSAFGFQDVSHTIDLTGRRCPEVKFLCVRLQKDTPYPDFRLLARNDDPTKLVGCTKFTCVAAPRPMVVVTSLGVVRSPYGSVRTDQTNRMTLDINVDHDRSASTDVAGDPGWVVEVWGSSKKNGKGRKVSPRTLDLGYEANRPFDARGTLRFGNVPYDYDLRGSTCAKARFLCAKLSRTRSDFVLKGRPSKALTRCTPVPCSNADGSASQTTPNRQPRPGRPVGGGPPQVRLASMRADFGTVRVNPTGNSNMDLTYYVTAAANSDVPVGKGLWHLGVYLSDQVDGSGSNRYAYTGNVLTPKQAKTPIIPGREVAIQGIGFEFPVSEIGCYPYYYLCLEFGKGTSTNYDMALPATGRMVSCDRQTCQS